ncbi:TPA: hypothetical protein DCX16_06235 [bacterium]|nr:hypothetical protein [bacterium]
MRHFLIILLFSSISFARVDTGADFLKFITSARVAGISGSFVGLADDVSTLHYNPAGLVNIKNKELLLMGSEGIMDCGYEYIGYGQKNKNSGIGFCVLYFHAPEMLRTEEDKEFGFRVLGTVEYYDLMVGFSYGRRVRNNLSIGGTIKGIHRMISPDKGYTCAVDLGVLYESKNNIKFGVSIQNVGSTIWKDELPRFVQIGGSYRIEELILTGAISHHLISKSKPEFRIGAEFWYLKILCLRAGYYSLEGELSGATLGGGIRITNWLQADFAQVPATLERLLQGSITIKF